MLCDMAALAADLEAVCVAVGYAAKLRCRTAWGIQCGQAALAIRAGMPSWPTCEGTVYMD